MGMVELERWQDCVSVGIGLRYYYWSDEMKKI